MNIRPFYKFNLFILVAICLFLSGFYPGTAALDKAFIFPIPQEKELLDGSFQIDESTLILLPQNASKSDVSLARFLVRELSDKYHIAVKIECVSSPPKGKNVIIMGTVENPLVREYCENQDIELTAKDPGTEGYVLKVDRNKIVAAGWDEQGAFYGLQSLRQLIKKDAGFKVPCLKVRDWPNMPFRGVRLYIPGTENIPFFKRFDGFKT